MRLCKFAMTKRNIMASYWEFQGFLFLQTIFLGFFPEKTLEKQRNFPLQFQLVILILRRLNSDEIMFVKLRFNVRNKFKTSVPTPKMIPSRARNLYPIKVGQVQFSANEAAKNESFMRDLCRWFSLAKRMRYANVLFFSCNLLCWLIR